MSSGPYGTPPGQPPGDTPEDPQPQEPQQPPEQPPAWLPQAQPEPSPPAPAAAPTPAGYPPPEPPPGLEPGYQGGYYPPPAYAAPPPARRSAMPLIAGVVVLVLLIAAIGAYVVGGFAYASTKLNSANDAYNKVVDHQNDLNNTVNGLSDKLTGGSATSATSADLQSYKSLVAQIVSKSQAAQGQIDHDDASLASADAGLHEQSWLTLVRKSDIDKESTRIGHARNALSAAKEITGDYIQIGTFFQTFYDVLIDIDTLGTKAQASDVTGTAAADEQLKTDTTKAISQDKAPGLPADMDSFLQTVMAVANDFSAIINAKTSSQETAAESALQADIKKFEGFDFNAMANSVSSFYKPLIDRYNSEVDKANST